MKKKVLLSLFGLLLIAAIVAVIAVYFFMGSMIRSGMETFTPRVTGVPLLVGEVDVSLREGRIDLHNVVLQNPDGYQSESAFQVGLVRLDIQPKSLFSDTIIIEEITVQAPEVTYERKLTSSNIGEIKANIERFSDDGGKTAEEPAAEGGGKAVQIDQLRVEKGSINLLIPALDKSAKLSLPLIAMNNIGGSDGKQSVPEALSEIFATVLNAVMRTVTEDSDVLKNSLDALKESSGDAGKALQDGASQAVESFKTLLGK